MPYVPLHEIMKVKTLKKNKVNIVTLGCSKNLVDSERLMNQLKNNKIDVSHESTKEDFDIVVINTCGFIDDAKEESIDTILRYCDLKNKGYIDKVYVTGCLVQRYKEQLSKEIPEVNAYFGTKELPSLLKKLKADYKKELIGERLLTSPSHYAYVKISEGCNRSCSFCAIPIMRGKHESRSVDSLVKEVSQLAKQGVKEIILIAQELTYYGLDIYKKRSLAALLNTLCEIEGIEWIRLHYAYPNRFPMDVVETMASQEKVCNYLDIPLQHASNKVLKDMKRNTSKEEMSTLIYNIRQMVPDIAIRTTMLVGYPTERLSDFEELKTFIKEMKFERMGVFTYSHEEGTKAYHLKDKISEIQKKQRAKELMEIQQEISFNINQQKIGKRFKVLFDKLEGNQLIGRTCYDSPEVDNEVLVSSNDNNIIGSFKNVLIKEASEFDLIGEIVS